MDLPHLPCEDPQINDVIPLWNPTEVANAERQRLQGINFLNFVENVQLLNLYSVVFITAFLT